MKISFTDFETVGISRALFFVNFCRRTVHSAAYTLCRCVLVCPFVWCAHSCILSKRLNASLSFFTLATPVFIQNIVANCPLKKGLNGDIKSQVGHEKNPYFRAIIPTLLYLGNDTIGHS